MSSKKTKKRKIRFRPSTAQITAAAAAVLIITYLAIRFLPAETLFIYSERYVYSENADLFIFKQEEYVILTDQQSIKFNVDEGDKIAGSTELSSDYKVHGDVYIQQKIKAIDYILSKSPRFQSKEEIYGEVQKLDVKISELNDVLAASAWETMTENEKSVYINEMNDLNEQRQIILRSVQYIYTPDEELREIKKTCTGMLGSRQVALNAYNLNLSVYGNIYFSLDGYEDVMTFHNIENFDQEYLNYLLGYAPKKQQSEGGRYVIKSSASDKILLALRVSKDCYVESEEKCRELYQSNTIRYDMDKQGGYYEFLFRRIDILAYYPKMTVVLNSSDSAEGHLVNVIETETHKILVIAVRDNIKNLQQQKRIDKAKAETQSFNAFVVPASAVTEHNYSEYVTVLTNSNVRKSVKVSVYDYSGGKAVLKISDNSGLKNGDEILAVGEYTDD